MANNNDRENSMQYMPIGMCIGIGVGMAIGSAMGNIGVGMCLGLSIGMGIGVAVDSMNRKNHNANSQDDQSED